MIPLGIRTLFCFVGLVFLWLPSALFSAQQPPRLIDARRQNIRLDDVLLKLTLPDQLPEAIVDYPLVNVIWLTEGSQDIRQSQVQIHPGAGYYDLRAKPGWTGKLAGYQAIFPELGETVPLEFIVPTLSDELAVSLSPQPLNLNRINHSNDLPYLFGVPVLVWSVVLVLAAFLTIRFLAQRSWQQALAVSLTIGFLTWDVRFWLDHIGIANQFAVMNDHVPMTGAYREFALETQKIFSTHQAEKKAKPTWTHDGMNQMPRFQLRYHLAEFPWKADPAEADFRITTTQKMPQPSQPVLHQHSGLILLDGRRSTEAVENMP